MPEKPEIGIDKKILLTLIEAEAYSGIGRDKLREITEGDNPLVLWNGNKRLIKRIKLEEYLNNEYSI